MRKFLKYGDIVTINGEYFSQENMISGALTSHGYIYILIITF